jgi:hypothetical protein
MHKLDTTEGPGSGQVISPDELKRWRESTQKARSQAARLGLTTEFEAEFRKQKKTHNPAEAARLALEAVALPKLLEEMTR